MSAERPAFTSASIFGETPSHVKSIPQSVAQHYGLPLVSNRIVGLSSSSNTTSCEQHSSHSPKNALINSRIPDSATGHRLSEPLRMVGRCQPKQWYTLQIIQVLEDWHLRTERLFIQVVRRLQWEETVATTGCCMQGIGNSMRIRDCLWWLEIWLLP